MTFEVLAHNRVFILWSLPPLFFFNLCPQQLIFWCSPFGFNTFFFEAGVGTVGIFQDLLQVTTCTFKVGHRTVNDQLMAIWSYILAGWSGPLERQTMSATQCLTAWLFFIQIYRSTSLIFLSIYLTYATFNNIFCDDLDTHQIFRPINVWFGFHQDRYPQWIGFCQTGPFDFLNLDTPMTWTAIVWRAFNYQLVL